MSNNSNNSTLTSSPPKEAITNMRLKILQDPVYGSPEYSLEEVIKPTLPQQRGRLLGSIPFIDKEKAIETTEVLMSWVGEGTLDTIDSVVDLGKQIISRGEAKQSDTISVEQKQAEQVRVREILESLNQKVQVAQKRETVIDEVKEEARFGEAGLTDEQKAKESHHQAGYRLVKNIYNRAARFFSRLLKSIDETRKAGTPPDILKGRANKMVNLLRQDKIAEGGLLSSTGGAGVG